MSAARICGWLCFAWAAAIGLARAADTTAIARAESPDLTALSLEDLMNVPVRAASGFEQRTSEAPSSVTLLTRNDLRAFGYRNLADALSSVAGFYSTYDRTYHTLGVRGFNRPGDYDTRTLVLVNGVRVNDPIYSTGRVGMDFPLDLDLIERIEIVRGPSSSLYGSSAFFAVINVVTREAKDVAPAEVAASAGSYDAFSGRFSLAHVFGEKGSILISGTWLNSEGDDLYFPLFDSPENNNGMADDLDGERVGSLFLQARYGDWTLQAVHVDRRKDRPTASYGTIFNDPDAEDRDWETLVDLSWAGDLSGAWQGMARAGYQRYEYGADWPYDYADSGQPVDRGGDEDAATAESVGGEARVSTEVIPRNKLTAGADVRHTFRLDQHFVSAGEMVLDSDETQTDFGVYMQDEIRLFPWALVNAGLRYDGLEPYGDSDLSPRAALILTPAEGSVIKLIYGEAFRAPNAYERFYDDGGASSKPNPELEPETIRSYELVWEQRVVQWFQLNAAVYRYEIEDLITQTLDPADGLLVFRNLDAVEAQGFEIEGRVDLRAGFKARGSYAYCRAENASTDERLSNSPEHMAKLNLLAPVVPRWLTAGVEVQYLSDRLTVAREEAEEVVVVNATLLTQRLKGGFDLALSVYNVFDEAYSVPVGEEIEGGSVQQDGRTFRIKATKRF
jgi:outer membrane receptor for ferrienterochelin and colicins